MSEDKQSILFETLKPHRLFSELTLPQKSYYVVVPISLLLFIVYSLKKLFHIKFVLVFTLSCYGLCVHNYRIAQSYMTTNTLNQHHTWSLCISPKCRGGGKCVKLARRPQHNKFQN